MKTIAATGAFAVLLLAMALAPARAAEKSADARLRAIYSAEWKWREAQFVDTDDDTKPVADHLPKADPAAQLKRLAVWRKVMGDLDAIPYAQLSPKEKSNYDVYRPQIADLIATQEFRGFEMPANSDSSFWSDLGYTARRPFRTPADYKNWIAQMRDIPRYFREEIAEMRAGMTRGFTPPRVTLIGRDASIKAVVEAKPEDSLFFTPFKQMPASIKSAEQAHLKVEALKVIEGMVQPAYGELLKFWNGEYVPHARQALAAETLPDGKAYYRQQIIEYTTLDLTPDAIHKIGLGEVEKLHAEMIAAMKQTDFTGDFPAFLAYLRSDPKFAAKTPQELLNDAAWIAKEFDGKASRYFGLLPRARFAIRPVPDDLAPFYTSGRGGPGLYEVNTYDLPHRPLYALTALTLHESAPGHAFQMPLALEDKTLPDFRRHSYISAYGEGWALYCEWLGQEMGMYKTPYDRFGMLSYQIWRAARLVVDTGIHAKGWTREQAIKYLHDYTALPDHEIETEVDRYIAWPGQALSYYLGEIAILKARERSEKALGAKFNIRAFHDTVLQLGSVPLPVLEKRIDAFIAGGGKGPYPDLE